MKRIVYMDLRLLEGLEIPAPIDPDPELVHNVNDALEKLDPLPREILKGRYYDGMTIDSLAAKHGISESKIRKLIYEAVRQMRIHLSDFVKAKWEIETGNTCRVCVHPQRKQIEEILRHKKQSESWRAITERIFGATNERFHPPQVLKAHLEHMSKQKGNTDEQR